jgi:hypothetical protein
MNWLCMRLSIEARNWAIGAVALCERDGGCLNDGRAVGQLVASDRSDGRNQPAAWRVMLIPSKAARLGLRLARHAGGSTLRLKSLRAWGRSRALLDGECSLPSIFSPVDGNDDALDIFASSAKIVEGAKYYFALVF